MSKIPAVLNEQQKRELLIEIIKVAKKKAENKRKKQPVEVEKAWLLSISEAFSPKTFVAEVISYLKNESGPNEIRRGNTETAIRYTQLLAIRYTQLLEMVGSFFASQLCPYTGFGQGLAELAIACYRGSHAFWPNNNINFPQQERDKIMHNINDLSLLPCVYAVIAWMNTDRSTPFPKTFLENFEYRSNEMQVRLKSTLNFCFNMFSGKHHSRNPRYFIPTVLSIVELLDEHLQDINPGLNYLPLSTRKKLYEEYETIKSQWEQELQVAEATISTESFYPEVIHSDIFKTLSDYLFLETDSQQQENKNKSKLSS